MKISVFLALLASGCVVASKDHVSDLINECSSHCSKENKGKCISVSDSTETTVMIQRGVSMSSRSYYGEPVYLCQKDQEQKQLEMLLRQKEAEKEQMQRADND